MTDWLGIAHLFGLSRTEAMAEFFTPMVIFAVFFLEYIERSPAESKQRNYAAPPPSHPHPDQKPVRFSWKRSRMRGGSSLDTALARLLGMKKFLGAYIQS